MDLLLKDFDLLSLKDADWSTYINIEKLIVGLSRYTVSDSGFNFDFIVHTLGDPNAIEFETIYNDSGLSGAKCKHCDVECNVEVISEMKNPFAFRIYTSCSLLAGKHDPSALWSVNVRAHDISVTKKISIFWDRSEVFRLKNAKIQNSYMIKNRIGSNLPIKKGIVDVPNCYFPVKTVKASNVQVPALIPIDTQMVTVKEKKSEVQNQMSNGSYPSVSGLGSKVKPPPLANRRIVVSDPYIKKDEDEIEDEVICQEFIQRRDIATVASIKTRMPSFLGKVKLSDEIEVDCFIVYGDELWLSSITGKTDLVGFDLEWSTNGMTHCVVAYEKVVYIISLHDGLPLDLLNLLRQTNIYLSGASINADVMRIALYAQCVLCPRTIDATYYYKSSFRQPGGLSSVAKLSNCGEKGESGGEVTKAIFLNATPTSKWVVYACRDGYLSYLSAAALSVNKEALLGSEI